MNEPAASSSPIAVFAIGFAFMRAWGLTYLGNNGVRFPLETMADISLLAFAPTLLASLGLLAWFADQGSIDILSRNSIIVGGTLTCASGLLMSMGVDLFFTAEIIGGVGYALLLLQWGVVSSYVSFRRLTSSLMAGLPVAGLVCVVLCFVPTPALPVVFSLFGPASSWCIARMASRLQRDNNPEINLSTGENATASNDQTWSASGRKLLARMVIALFLLELVGRSTLMLSGEFAVRVVGAPSYSFALARFAGTLGAALLYTVFVARSKRPLRIVYLLTPVLLIASCLFIIFGQLGLSHITYSLAFSAGAWLETAFWLFFSHSFKKIGRSPVYVWAWGRGAFWFSTLVGVVLWTLQSTLFKNGVIYNGDALTTLIVLLALVAMFTYTVVLPESAVASLGIMRDRDMDDPAVQSDFDEIARILATEAKLSPRETEVFLLLAHGRDTSFIQDKLIISQGTVCSHRDRIYRKLGVHSKRELIDLVDGALRNRASRA